MWSHSFIQSLTPFSWGHLSNTLSATLNIALAIKISDTPHYENVPFEVPAGWEWTEVASFTYDLLYGTSEKSSNDGSVPVLRMGNITRYGTIDYTDLVYSSNDGDIIKYQLQKNDLLFNRTNSSEWVGKTAIFKADTPTIYAGYLIRVRCILLCPDYINLVMNSSYHRNWCNQVKTDAVNQSNINAQKLSKLLIPIPPYQEQLRIVKEVQRWTDVIDDLEKNKQDLQDVIKQTKGKVLDLAIHGKLVPQDSMDEPASELLKRINPDAKPCDTSHYKNIPSSWCVCTLKDVFEITMGSSPKGSSINTQKNGIEFHQGKISFTDMHLQETNVYTDEPTKLAEPHSILLCVRAPVGIVNITERNVCIGRGLCALKPTVGVDYKFAFYTLQTHKANFDKQATGTTFKAIGGDIIRNEKYVLPPYQEQIRIREKIEYILQLLNAITAEL